VCLLNRHESVLNVCTSELALQGREKTYNSAKVIFGSIPAPDPLEVANFQPACDSTLKMDVRNTPAKQALRKTRK
jgi:hypothetical protein